MKVPGRNVIRMILTSVLVLLAIFMNVRAQKNINFYRTQIEARHGELETLQELTQSQIASRAAFGWLQQHARPNERLEDLVKQQLSNVKTDLVLREVKQVGDRWNIYRYDMRLENVSTKQFSEFLVLCENARPPVRITELQVSVQEDHGGMITTQLSLAEIVPADIVSNQ